jgi:hypothetical protein
MSRCFEGGEPFTIVCPASCPCTVDTRRAKRQLEQAVAAYFRARWNTIEGRAQPLPRKPIAGEAEETE